MIIFPIDNNFHYLYNGKELNRDFDINLYEYGARWYDPAIGRFTGVDPIADQFAWVSTYNYAENEPVANIDLHGLQKYKPKMQDINGPGDLFSFKMLYNAYEGAKAVVYEAASEVREKVNQAGDYIEGLMPAEGTPTTEEFHDTGEVTDGTGYSILSASGLSTNGTLKNPEAGEGVDQYIATDGIVTLGEAGGVVGDAATASQNATNASNAIFYIGKTVDAIKGAVDKYNEQNPSSLKKDTSYMMGDHKITKFRPEDDNK